MQLKKILKDIPLPKRGREPVYPFAEMKVGDSFLYSDKTDRKSVMAASASYSQYSRRNTKGKWKFTQRVTDEGIMIWRVK